jgi:hypothetical protein
MTLMTDEQMDEVAAVLPLVKAWVTAFEAELKRRIHNGSSFENVREVPTDARRNWKEGLDILKILRKFSRLDVVAPRVPLSPAQAEKTLGKGVYGKHLADHVEKTSSGTKLAFKD